jgi:hypothetical protein
MAFGLGLLFSNRPAIATADPEVRRGKCVGVAATPQPGGSVSVYRAWEDGTVEESMSGPDRKWQEIGRQEIER